MSKVIETDLRTFVKFWLVPLGIGIVLLFLYSAKTALTIIGLSIFLALALKPLVRRVNNFFNRHLYSPVCSAEGKRKKIFLPLL